MSMKEIVLEMRRQLDLRNVDALAYCLAGHNYIAPDSVVGESHGACPGPVLVVERNPDAAAVSPIAGGVVREAPPCSRCFGSTALIFPPVEPGLEQAVKVGTLESSEGEEWSFDLELGGNRAEVCLRCLAAALAEHDPAITLHGVRGRTVPWRS